MPSVPVSFFARIKRRKRRGQGSPRKSTRRTLTQDSLNTQPPPTSSCQQCSSYLRPYHPADLPLESRKEHLGRGRLRSVILRRIFSQYWQWQTILLRSIPSISFGRPSDFRLFDDPSYSGRPGPPKGHPISHPSQNSYPAGARHGNPKHQGRYSRSKVG